MGVGVGRVSGQKPKQRSEFLGVEWDTGLFVGDRNGGHLWGPLKMVVALGD